jgi:acetate---CoA ligase (ADP-forming)
LAASDVTVDALFRQSGVIRCDSLTEMLDVADLLAHQPLPGGRLVGIVTNVGGPGVMCADACEAHALDVPELEQSTQDRLRSVLPAEASVANPVDMLAAASADQYQRAVQIVAEDPNIDSVIAIFLPPLATKPADVACAIGEATSSLNGAKPILAVFVSAHALPRVRSANGSRVPTYALPEPAVVALARAVRYAA